MQFDAFSARFFVKQKHEKNMNPQLLMNHKIIVKSPILVVCIVVVEGGFFAVHVRGIDVSTTCLAVFEEVREVVSCIFPELKLHISGT